MPKPNRSMKTTRKTISRADREEGLAVGAAGAAAATPSPGCGKPSLIYSSILPTLATCGRIRDRSKWLWSKGRIPIPRSGTLARKTDCFRQVVAPQQTFIDERVLKHHLRCAFVHTARHG